MLSSTSNCLSLNSSCSVQTNARQTSQPQSELVERMRTFDRFEDYINLASEAVGSLINGTELPEKYQVYGMTLLHWLVLSGDKTKLTEVCERMSTEQLLQGINQANDAVSLADASFTLKGNESPAINADTPLGIALYLDNKLPKCQGMAEELMDRLPPMSLENAINDTGNSLLNLAAGGGSLAAVKEFHRLLGDELFTTLVDRATFPGGSTPLHHAAKGTNPELFGYLLRHSDGHALVTPDLGSFTPQRLIEKKLSDMSEQKQKLEELALSEKAESTEQKIAGLDADSQKWQAILTSISTQTTQQSAQIPANALSV